MKETGGAAFPTKNPQKDRRNQVIIYEEGMTLRDYFAAKAMQGLLANPGAAMCPVTLVAYAYETADAMIAERDRGE